MCTNYLKSSCLFLLLISVKSFLGQLPVNDLQQVAQIEQNNVLFTENKGQVSDQNYLPRPDVLFYGKSGGLNFYMMKSGISYQQHRIDNWREEIKGKNELKTVKVPDSMTIYRTDIRWIGSNENVEVQPIDAQHGYNNFYTHVCPNGATGVKSYAAIVYKDIYKGIDLKYYEKNGLLEYDYIIQPGSNYKLIKWKIEGSEEIAMNQSGDLIIRTEFGEIRELAPKAYQNDKEVSIRWLVHENTIGFEIENYDVAKPLVIDPIVRMWGTYYGGDRVDVFFSSAIDNNSDIYLAGYTNSGSGIATLGTHKSVKIGFDTDAMLIKFDSNGVLKWGTYYGGLGSESLYASCDVVGDSIVYLAGVTTSTDGISTSGSYQPSYGGGTHDAYLVKFNSNGIRIWGTYYGGSDRDWGWSCRADGSSSVYLAGDTRSASGISTAGGHQTTFGGIRDAFIVKFNSSGQRQWATYYGGSLRDRAYSCAVDDLSNVYLTGSAQSGNAISSPGSYQTVLQGSEDIFLVKFNSSGLRQWGTYYGGLGTEYAHHCNIDGSNDIVLVGRTSGSGAVMASPGTYQQSQFGNVDGFVAKFSSAGLRKWGTYFGGNNSERVQSCSFDKDNNIFITGFTTSDSGIATPNCYEDSLQSISTYDAFLAKFNKDGQRIWSTYYGGEVLDDGQTVSVHGSSVYIAGDTDSGTGMHTPGAHQGSLGGPSPDGFIAKFYDCNLDKNVTRTDSTIIANQLNATYQWLDCDNAYQPISGATSQTFKPDTSGNYAVAISKYVCKDTSACQQITLVNIPDGFGKSDFSKNIVLYPNPNKGEFTLDLGENKDVFIRIYDGMGQEVLMLSNKTGRNIHISIDEAPGLYTVKIDSENGDTAFFKMLKTN